MSNMINLDQIAAEIRIDESTRVVLLDVAGRKDIPVAESNANIYCIDDQGAVIWQISGPSPKMERDSFVSLRQTDEGLRADRFFGAEFVVDSSTGVATEVGWHK